MPWNWRLKGWPTFRWRSGLLEQEERRFAEGVSVTLGSLRHLPTSDRDNLAIGLLERDARAEHRWRTERSNDMFHRRSSGDRQGLDGLLYNLVQCCILFAT